jgi:SAM-dependent methyltransferase
VTDDRRRTYLTLEYAHRDELPAAYDHDIRTPDALVETVVSDLTHPGDRVFDPFAGFGTTLVSAARLDRVPYGLEYEPDRVAYVRDRLNGLAGDDGGGEDGPTPAVDETTTAAGGTEGDADPAEGRRPSGGGLDAHVRQGDVRNLDASWFPAMDCAFTSPPFATHGLGLNPFQNYDDEGSYEAYLDDITTAFDRVADVLAPGGRLVIDVVNMRNDDHVTPLAFDVADRVAGVSTLRFDGETVVTWEDGGESDERDGLYGYGFDHSYCLRYTKTGTH